MAEIPAIQKKIENVIDYHEMLWDSSGYYSRFEGTVREPFFFAGVRTSILPNNAFETGIQTGLINGLTFDEIQFLNQVYTFQKSYDDFQNYSGWLYLSGF